MTRARRGKPVHGIVLLDKPEGMSSNQALQAARRLFDARKAGHTGSLDPFATGMLPLCFGEATKTAGFMLDADKAYRAKLKLGQATDTGDTEGRVIEQGPIPELDESDLRAALAVFAGEFEQVPPMYSALKHQGQPLYKLARAGRTVERTPRKVTIHDISLLGHDPDSVEFEVCCSKGTYIRTLAEDIGRRLGSCAHLVALRRLWVQPFEQRDMVSVDDLHTASEAGDLGRYLLPLDAGLQAWPVCDIAADDAQRFKHGSPVRPEPLVSGWCRVRGPDGRPIGLGEGDRNGLLHPRRVFQYGEDT